MPVSGITASDIVAFAAREGNKMIEAQVNMKAKLFAALDKMPMKGKRSVINVVNGGLASTAQVLDFGTLPSEAAVVPAQGFVDAVAYVSRLGLGRIALQTLSGVDDSADLLDLHLQLAADDMARQIGRAVFGSQLSSPQLASTGTDATSTPSFTQGSWSAVSGGQTSVTIRFTGGLADFREGEAYIWEPAAPASGAANAGAFHVLCTSVVLVQDNKVDVTFVAGVGGVPGFDTSTYATAVQGNLNPAAGNIATGDAFFLRGSRLTTATGTGLTGNNRGPSTAAPVSLADITGTGNLHGLTVNTNGWSGVTFASVGSPTAELFMGRSKILQARAGVAPTHLVMNPLASVSYAAAQIANGSVGNVSGAQGIGNVASQGRRNVDGKLDKYGKDADLDSGLTMFGRPVVLDDNCPVQSAFLINKDYLKVGEWKKLSAEDEGGSPLLLSRSTFSKEVQFSCIYNLVCRKRNAHAALTGITL